MTKAQTWWLVIISTTLVLGLALLVASGSNVGLFPEPTVPGQEASAAILAFVTATAVGIERVIETFWTVAGQTTNNTRWPLTVVTGRVEGLVSNMNENLRPFLERVQEGVDRAENASEQVSEELRTAKKRIEEIKGHMSEMQALAPNNPRVRAAAAAASRGIGYLEGQYPDLQERAQGFNSAVSQVDEFLNSFNDNPARRLISIYVGAFFGLLLAGVLGLDLIGATLGEDPFGSGNGQPWWNNVLPNLGAAATGLVMGLGASPTHELIKTLQETKKARKAENNAS